MSALSIRKIAPAVIACVLAMLLLALPVYAMPRGIEESAADEITGTADPAPIGDGLEDNTFTVTEEEARARGNLGDTDGDGKIEGENTTAVEQDPMHAAQYAASRSSWITAAVCIVAVVTLILIIVAMIPKKRM